MKRTMTIAVMIMTLLSLAFAPAGWAEVSKEERTLEQEASRLSKTAGQPEGERAVVRNMEKEFNVTQEQIQALRDKKLGYGEIAVAFSLAQNMPGGITDENMNKIMTMRQGPPTMGWGRIAKELGTKLGPAVSRVKSMNKETAREMKQANERRQERKSETGEGEKHREQHRNMTGGEHGGGKTR